MVLVPTTRCGCEEVHVVMLVTDWWEVNRWICCQSLGISDQVRWRMIYPKCLYTLGAFGVDGVPAFYPLHGRVLGVQDQCFRTCRPHCQLGVQISCCVDRPTD